MPILKELAPQQDYLYDNYGTDKYLSALRSVESDSGSRTEVEGIPRFTLTPADPKSKKIPVAAPTTEASNAPGYINPNAGRLLGYIYEDPESRTRSMAQQTPNDKQIPIYDSPFSLALNNKPLSAASRFAVGAKLAGAFDAPIVDDENKSGNGILNSHLFSGDVRKGLGLPNSFDMVRNMDPTKQDWGSMNWGLYNPKSSGFFGDMFQALGPLIRPLDALGLPPALQNAIKIGAAIATGGASTAAEAGSEIAGELAAQELAQQAAEQAIANAFAGTVAQGIGATAAGGITGLLSQYGITGIGADMVKNAGMNAAIAAATGQDPFTAALKGAASAGVGGAVAESDLLEGASQNTINMAAGAAKAATGAALSGGNIFDAASQGALTGALSGSKGAGVKTFPVSGPESIPMTQLPTPDQNNFEQFLAGLNASAPTATEDWIDKAGLVEQPQTMDDFINALLVKDASAATPTEDWIDRAGLVEQPRTPLEIEIAGTSGSTATPTEDWIDKGGLGGEPGGTEAIGVGATAAPGIGATGPSGGLGGLIGALLGGGAGGAGGTRPATTTRPAAGGAQSQGTDLLSMLALMNMQKQQAAPPPIPLVGEIKPYQFSTDLLEGLYPKPRMAQGGSINDLMRIVRG